MWLNPNANKPSLEPLGKPHGLIGKNLTPSLPFLFKQPPKAIVLHVLYMIIYRSPIANKSLFQCNMSLKC
jgi:hypothetical protein